MTMVLAPVPRPGEIRCLIITLAPISLEKSNDDYLAVVHFFNVFWYAVSFESQDSSGQLSDQRAVIDMAQSPTISAFEIAFLPPGVKEDVYRQLRAS
jgi:hypothetical protein